MTPSKLRVSGTRIHALIDEPVNCAEFTLKGDHYQRVASEPWIQFEPKEWTDMTEKLFGEMVDAWNEKHGKVSP